MREIEKKKKEGRRFVPGYIVRSFFHAESVVCDTEKERAKPHCSVVRRIQSGPGFIPLAAKFDEFFDLSSLFLCR